MRKIIMSTLIVVLGLLGLTPMVAGAASAASQAPAVTATHLHGTKTLANGSRRCTIHFSYSNGLTGGLFPKAFSKVEFTTSSCGNTIQTVVRYHPTALTGCTRAPLSGTTRKLHVWVQSTGPNKLYCDSWVRFHCAGCSWGPFEKLHNTSATQGNIELTAFSRPLRHHSGLTPQPIPGGSRDMGVNRIACGTACYHIREKNGAQFFMGFNSDQPTYWLRNKGAFDGRDFVLEGVSGTCTDGVSCFEAKMITLNNLEVVTTTCQQSGGNTFQLQNTGGTTGDVYKFITDNNGDNSIKSRYCDDFVSFQGALDNPLQLGSNPGEYWRVLYFAGT